MSASLPVWRIDAIRYAHHPARPPSMNYAFPDPHDGPEELTYYVWLLRNGDRSIVVDTGMTEASAKARGRTYLITPQDGIGRLGADVAAVKDVIITHMHWDHAGTWDGFPAAKFHLQDDEMSHVTGRHMGEPILRHSYAVEDVVGMVRQVYADRVVFHDGDGQVAPGVTLHGIGGHAAGLQIVRVWTRKGWLVLASDASHFYTHIERKRVFPTFWDMNKVVAGYHRCRELADAPELVIPGHDPRLMERYPVSAPGLEGVAIRID